MLSILTLLACAPTLPPEVPVEPRVTEVKAPVDDMGQVRNAPAMPGLISEADFKALHTLTGEAAPAPRGQDIDLAGTTAYLSLPEGASAPLPAVVVIHEWWGLNANIRHWTDRLAADGYAALAVDLYGGQVANTSDEAMALMKSVNSDAAQATLTAAHSFLGTDPRVQANKRAVIGWCFGGGWSLRHAIATPDLSAAVMYYGRPVTDAGQLARITAPLLGVFADQDKGIPPEAVSNLEDALNAAGKTVTVHRYDAQHAFANPSNQRYDSAAAEDAWGKVRAFLAEQLKDS